MTPQETAVFVLLTAWLDRIGEEETAHPGEYRAFTDEEIVELVSQIKAVTT